VFSLGVILYELLTGAWPYGESESLMSDLQRATGYRVPALPAAVVSEQAALVRSLPRARLCRLLRGDLSAITLKALENLPAHRYGSVQQLARDIRRFLAGRPVHARLQTPLYRGGKFLRRHWLLLSAAALVFLLLSVSTIYALSQARI